MNQRDIRQSFLDFFKEKHHVVVPSAPVIPAEDPTLMFTNAGMNQFKDVLLGLNDAKHRRVVNSQKCIRISGKHNDLEEVGYDTYHHTFFEMLGNWSFGDYTKKEAITWAWELLTEKWKLPENKLYATVYQSDDEAAELWRKHTAIDPAKILRFDEKDNFWEMGASGPCGPCSEIHIDLGASRGKGEGKDPKTGVNSGNPRFIEIWNLVFIQNNRRPDGSLEELPHKHIDTGMGFERIAAVLQGKTSNYDTDLFAPIIRATEALCGQKYRGDKNQVAMRVIADHLRAISFSIADGLMPSNEGRGYVIRRVLRRACRYGRNLGLTGPFLHTLLPVLEKEMSDFFKELSEEKTLVQKTILAEEEMFHRTLDKGLSVLEEKMTSLPDKGKLRGQDAFVLYDTYGFPLDLTALILKERGYSIDLKEFDRAMALQKARSQKRDRDQNSFTLNEILKALNNPTDYIGEEESQCEAELMAIIEKDKSVKKLSRGHALLVFDKSVFYGESGGQIGDTGFIEGPDARFEVLETRRSKGYILHRGQLLEGDLYPGRAYRLGIDASRRKKIRKNHSATHLLQRALKKILGNHVKQAGSLVAEDKLRFDFNHTSPLREEEIQKIEAEVNKAILENHAVAVEVMSRENAKQKGALAFFGEKYAEEVRVIDMGGYSIELCGGSHVRTAGEIGSFVILSESSSASGIRRIEATTGWDAYQITCRRHQLMKTLRRELQASSETQVLEKVRSLSQTLKTLKKEMAQMRTADLNNELASSQGEVIGEIKFIARQFKDMVIEALRSQIDRLKNGQAKTVVFLANLTDEKVVFLCGLTADLIPALKAGELVKEAATVCGGGGGGRSDFAQAGGKDVSKIDEAIEAVRLRIQNARSLS